MRRSQSLLAALVSALLGVALVAPGAGAQPSSRALERATGYYLALGDSLATGYQPDRGNELDGGYVGLVHDAATERNAKTRLVNLGCAGETSQTFVDGGHCDFKRGSQLAEMRHFLQAHGQFTRLVTIDIGANDVQRCLSGGVIDQACIERGMAAVSVNLPAILAELRVAAPQAQIVVLDYYNPFLAAWLQGPGGQTLAQQSAVLQQALNGIIVHAAAGAGADLARVSDAYQSGNWTLTSMPGAGQVPTNVALICAWTWMCTRNDIHANDPGYAVMARTVAALLRF